MAIYRASIDRLVNNDADGVRGVFITFPVALLFCDYEVMKYYCANPQYTCKLSSLAALQCCAILVLNI